MITNYFKSALRYLHRSSFYTALNLTGLVLGITASAFLFIFVWDELRYDTFHDNFESVYRITTHQQDGTTGVTTPGPLGPAIKELYPQVTDMVRIGKWSGALKFEEKLFEENEIYFTDNSFFNVFNFELLKGDQNLVLKKASDILLTEKTATKFFGKEWATRSDVLGAVLSLNGQEQFTVSGIVKNPPSYSSIQFDYLLSFKYVEKDRWNYQWGSHNFHTYLLLDLHARPESLEVEIKNFLRKYESNEGFALGLQPMENIYMQPSAGYDWGKHGQPQYVLIFSIIGSLILIIACFNYINIATSRATKRAKEIGVRKINGARRIDIFLQFMGESALFVFAAAFISRGILDFTLPLFNAFSGKSFIIEDYQFQLALLFISIALITTLIAGLYPAIVLSNFKSLSVLKDINSITSGMRFRFMLVTTQFVVSMILISGAVVLQQQLDFIKDKNVGFKTDELAYIKLAGGLKRNNENFKQEIQKLSYVHSATRSTTTLINTDNGSYVDWPGKKKGEEVTISQLNADSDFIPSLGIEVVAGRSFVQSDSNSYLLNEAALKAMGLSADKALGISIQFWGTEGTVVGIVKDFHFRPLHHAISPLIMRHNTKENFYQLLVRVDKNHLEEFIQDASKIYARYEENFPFSYGFVNDGLQDQYNRDKNASQVILYFSVLSIAISLLGVFGLISYTIEERTKEFCIRKILGSTYGGFLLLLGQRFIWCFLVAFVVATPVSFWIVTRWLENFNYKIEVTPWVFVLSFVLVTGLSVAVILIETMKGLRQNSVNSLRRE